jgi:dTDP-L-rhamnose 4-epimerase
MKHVLITGGAGFIGQRLALALVSQGIQVRILDIFNPQVHVVDTLPRQLASKVELIKADVRNRDAMRLALAGVDSVVHLAAETGTGQSMYEIERYFSVNVQGTATLLDLLQNDRCGESVRNLVVASSRAIYGEGAYRCAVHGAVYPDPRPREQMAAGRFEPTCPHCSAQLSLLPTPEDAPFKPMSVYGLTKQVQEQAVLMFAHTRGINAFGLRYQNVYGPGQSLKNPYTGILAVFSNLARQNQPIEIYEDGEESRDFVYIDDVVEATIRCVNHPGQFIGALNVGSGHATSVMTVAQQVKDYFGSQSFIGVTGAFRMGDIRHNIADISLTRNVLGFVPETSFKQGLVHFLGWAQNQPLEDKSAYVRSVSELAAKGLMGSQASPQ